MQKVQKNMQSVDFKFQSDSINTKPILKSSNVLTIFKFQSDSINTDDGVTEDIKADKL